MFDSAPEDDGILAGSSSGRSMDELASALGGDFDILRVLGTGSVATVFLAREKALSRLVAIKVMDPANASDKTTRRRFEREARAVASLSDHPNIASVYRFGQLPDSSPYIVMRFVKGRTVGERLTGEGPLPLDEAMTTLRGTASALVLAHSHGIVHRDLRPENVLWDDTTHTAVLGDFGIAAILATGAIDITRITRDQKMLGKPKYMSPEQILDEDVTEMSDMYSFGILGYYVLSGEGPYNATTDGQWVKAHLVDEPIPLGRRRSGIPPHVEELLMRCLSRQPKHRPTAKEALKVLAGGGAVMAGEAHGDGVDLHTLLKRRVPQIVLATAAVGYGFTEVVGNFVEQGGLRPQSFYAAWVLTISAIAGATVIAWFHGSRGRQRAPIIEFVLLAIVCAAGLTTSALIFFGAGP